MATRMRHTGRFPLIASVLVLGLSIWPVSSAMAHGGGGGGGGHGGGGFGGGHMGGGHMGGGHMGGMGYGHMGGMGYGHMGYGHMGGYGYGHHRGYGGLGYGGFGGYGFYPGFFGYGLGYGYPFLGSGYYGGYGLGGYGGYGLGLGLGGYGGYGLGGYGGYGGYGLGGYGGYGGYGYPYYGGYGYSYPYYTAGYAAPGAGVTYNSAYVAPAASAANIVMPAQGRYLGIDEDPITDSTGRKGMKVSNVYPGTPAQRAGLQVGDVIYSINGYLTEQRGNLAWIIANAAPNNQLNITLKRASDGQERAVTAQLQ